MKISESDYCIILKVGDFQVVFKYQNHKLMALCDCKSGSMLKPCAHVMAGIDYLIHE